MLSQKVRNEFFFTLSLTENEHYIVEDMIRQFCQANGLTVVYYRKFKTGHVPMQRECKVCGDIPKFMKFLEDEKITIGNYHKTTKEADALLHDGKLTFDQWYAKYHTA